jgi:hypothetical protein
MLAIGRSLERADASATSILAGSLPGSPGCNFIPEWEATLGLPDPCVGDNPTDDQRRDQVRARFIGTGGTSKQRYIEFAATLGFGVTIKNYAPFRVGRSAVGQPIASDEWTFLWAVSIVSNPDSLPASLLLCELNAIRPAKPPSSYWSDFMQRIDGPTVSATLPAPKPEGTGASAPGYFQDGNPTTLTAPTTVTRDWANSVQEEIIGVIEYAEIEPDKADNTQLRQAILAIAAGFLDLPRSLAQNGYYTLPGGFIVQWGRHAANANGSTAVTFPLEFPTACFVAVGGGGLAGNADAKDNWPDVDQSTITKSGFSFISAADDSISAGWIAVGN